MFKHFISGIFGKINPQKIGIFSKSTGIWLIQPSFHTNFLNTWEIHHISCTILIKLLNLLKITPNNWGYPQFANFHKFLAIVYVVLQGSNSKVQATTQNSIMALFYKINLIQKPTSTAEITENSLNLVPCTNLKLVRNSC